MEGIRKNVILAETIVCLQAECSVLSGGMDGMTVLTPLRLVTGEDAKLYELNYIARFDTKMHEFPIRIYNPIEDRNYRINSWGEGHLGMSAGSDAAGHDNSRSVYAVEARKYRVFGEKVKKVVVELVLTSR